MRNFFKNQLEKITGNPNRRDIEEILDTDEDKVINQYKRYLNYINNVKRELIEKSSNMVGYKKRKLSI